MIKIAQKYVREGQKRDREQVEAAPKITNLDIKENTRYQKKKTHPKTKAMTSLLLADATVKNNEKKV